MPSALVLALGGAVVALSAASASAVGLYGESATSCGSLLSPKDQDFDTQQCEGYADDRRAQVIALLFVAVGLLAAAVWRTIRRPTQRSHGTGDPGPRPTARETLLVAGAVFLTVPVVAAVVLLAGYTLVSGTGQAYRGLPDGWLVPAQGLGLLVACRWTRRIALPQRQLTSGSCLLAVALAAPWTGIAGSLYLAGALGAAGVLLAAGWQATGLRAPTRAVAGLLIVSELGTATVVSVSEASAETGRAVAVVNLAAVLVLAVGANRRTPIRGPAAPRQS